MLVGIKIDAVSDNNLIINSPFSLQNYMDADQFLKFVDDSRRLLPGGAAEWKDNHIHSPYL